MTGAEHREREAMGPVRDGDGGNLAWLASRDELGAVVDEALFELAESEAELEDRSA